jgi:hypothetical protein
VEVLGVIPLPITQDVRERPTKDLKVEIIQDLSAAAAAAEVPEV